MMQGSDAELSDLSDALLKLLQTSKADQSRGSSTEQLSAANRSRFGSWPPVPPQLASPGPQDLRASQNAVPWQGSAAQSLAGDAGPWNRYDNGSRSTGSHPPRPCLAPDTVALRYTSLADVLQP